MSYNNTGDKRDARSNNRISHDEIISILENKGKVTVFEEKYKEFTTGNTILDVNHKETLYFCEVFKKD
jgi:adenine-specific DNA-methyltransferase